MTDETPALPADLYRVVDAFRTCELVTISAKGIPIAWPTTSVYRPDDGTFVISTSIGFPQKAVNVRRNPHVALLFSEPTGSGITAAPQVLVQGMAECPDDVQSGFLANSDLWRRVFAFQPSSRLYPSNPVTRRIMDAYFMRLFITVTPTSISSSPALTGISQLSVRTARDTVLERSVAALATYRTSVLAVIDSTGSPVLTRVTLRRDNEGIIVTLPDNVDIGDGTASILSHAHDEKLWSLRSVVAIGTISRDGATVRFAPERIVAGSDGNSVAGALATVRTLRATAKRYLTRRGLPRPRVAWNEYRAIRPLIAETARTHTPV